MGACVLGAAEGEGIRLLGRAKTTERRLTIVFKKLADAYGNIITQFI